MQATTQYDAFARDYHWIFGNERLTGEYEVENCRQFLKDLPSDPRILDCACGIGTQALAFARHGYDICGTDASAGMIREARKLARQAGMKVRFQQCAWRDLPRKFGRQFDLVLCRGNAIGHCRNEHEMVNALRGIRSVLKDTGSLILDTRNWEKICAEKTRFSTLGPRIRNGHRCVILYVWNYPKRRTDPHTIEVVMIFETDGRLTVRNYPITYYPFRFQELIRRLKAAGFGSFQTNYTRKLGDYFIRAGACPENDKEDKS